VLTLDSGAVCTDTVREDIEMTTALNRRWSRWLVYSRAKTVRSLTRDVVGGRLVYIVQRRLQSQRGV